MFFSYRSCCNDVMYYRRFLSSVCLLPSVIQGYFMTLCIGEVPSFSSISYFVHLCVSVETNAVSTLHEKYRNKIIMLIFCCCNFLISLWNNSWKFARLILIICLCFTGAYIVLKMWEWLLKVIVAIVRGKEHHSSSKTAFGILVEAVIPIWPSFSR
jgi:hypothetical protein